MTRAIISSQDLGKRYRVVQKEIGERYLSLRDVITAGLKRTLTTPGRNRSENRGGEEFWALKNVSFDVTPGEVVGVIGRNGAGKSTLLKVLSRITEPSAGRVLLTGRVASLLEVGTGFHPELTGRENIYLNGAILGMRRREIDRNFSEIVEFAEVERFLDTPVKRYSSGMYVRLAFAVAAHLEPEILIVDEVLAVGDAAFQKKCLSRMRKVAAGGRTVLFVSHNMNAVEQLCRRCLLLKDGEVIADSTDVRDVINQYHNSSDLVGTGIWTAPTAKRPPVNPYFSPTEFMLTDGSGAVVSGAVSRRDPVWVTIKGDLHRLDPALNIGYAIYTESGTLLYWSYQTDGPECEWPSLTLGSIVLKSQLPTFLNEGTYVLELICGLHCREWLSEPRSGGPTIQVEVLGGLSESPMWLWRRPGELGPVISWLRA